MQVSKVLVVDDSPTDLENLRSIISNAGCSVLSACNGLDAIEMARQELPHIIFLDILMPDMDGFQTCRRLIADEKTRHIPVVFVTSKRQKADRIWAQMQGGKDLVTKPYEPHQIIDQLHAF